MMSPLFPPPPPLKVDAGGLSPQPETPDTPVSPYLSSPDEVTVSLGSWEWPKSMNPSPPALTHSLPKRSSLIGLLWQIPLQPLLPAKSMISTSPFTLHFSTRQDIPPISTHTLLKKKRKTVWIGGKRVHDPHMYFTNHTDKSSGQNTRLYQKSWWKLCKYQ